MQHGTVIGLTTTCLTRVLSERVPDRVPLYEVFVYNIVTAIIATTIRATAVLSGRGSSPAEARARSVRGTS